MTIRNKILYSQAIIIIFTWLLLLVIPLFFENYFNDNEIKIPKIWYEFSWVFGLFLINRFVLMPYLFFKRKHIRYFITISSLVGIMFTALYFSTENRNTSNHAKTHTKTDVQVKTDKDRNPKTEISYYKQRKSKRMFIPPIANFFILTILILGFDTGLNISTRWMIFEQKRTRLENENTSVKLALLQNQISPHFFMNTLNNIHSLVDIDKEKSKDSIIRLSKLMSYLLYETNTTKVSINSEFDFITNYVSLMKLRYSEKVKIENIVKNNIPNIEVPPLLFLNFIENAFKYGVSYREESYIKMSFLCNANYVEFDIKNTNHASVDKGKREGLGIKNTRNRLDLIYGNKYQLNIDNNDKIFHVNLIIPV